MIPSTPTPAPHFSFSLFLMFPFSSGRVLYAFSFFLLHPYSSVFFLVVPLVNPSCGGECVHVWASYRTVHTVMKF